MRLAYLTIFVAILACPSAASAQGAFGSDLSVQYLSLKPSNGAIYTVSSYAASTDKAYAKVKFTNSAPSGNLYRCKLKLIVRKSHGLNSQWPIVESDTTTRIVDFSSSETIDVSILENLGQKHGAGVYSVEIECWYNDATRPSNGTTTTLPDGTITTSIGNPFTTIKEVSGNPPAEVPFLRNIFFINNDPSNGPPIGQ